MKLKDIYSIPKYSELDGVGKIIFALSFVLPLGIIYTFLHLYFLPFGLDRTHSIEDREVGFVNEDFFYTIDDKELLDGRVDIQVDSRFPIRYPFVTASVEGENAYIRQHHISNNDIVFESSFEKKFDEDFEYKLVEDYVVNDEEEILVFKVEYDIDWETQGNNELLLKHKNLRIIQNSDNVVLRVDEIKNGEFETYTADFSFYSEDHEEPITLYAIYKKPNETNGFIEIITKNRSSNRTILPTQREDDEKEKDEEIYEVETIWNSELERDISQKFISLKQEQYTKELREEIPLEFRDLVNINSYYEKKYKPEEFDIEEGEVAEEDEEEIKMEMELENGESVSLVGDGYFRYEEDNDDIRYQVFYKKDFFNDFQGEITKISVGYNYPVKQKKELSVLFEETPFTITVFGKNSKIENLKINLYREPVWEKF